MRKILLSLIDKEIESQSSKKPSYNHMDSMEKDGISMQLYGIPKPVGLFASTGHVLNGALSVVTSVSSTTKW